jgi:hypothetical protein
MNLRRYQVLAIVACFVACKSQQNSEIGTFPADFATATLDRMDRCAPMAAYLRAQRQTTLAASLATELTDARDAGVVTFDSDSYDDCYAATRARPCEAPATQPTAACATAARGTVQPGAACQGFFDCLPESFCRSLDGRTGTCAPLATANPGQSCFDATSSKFAGCRGDTYCQGGGSQFRCSALGGTGALCDPNLCDDSSWCPIPQVFSSGPPLSQCLPKLGAGTACTNGATPGPGAPDLFFDPGISKPDCRNGLLCVGLASTEGIFGRLVVQDGTCAAPGDENAGCLDIPDGGISHDFGGGRIVLADQVESGCREGSICSNGVCVRF